MVGGISGSYMTALYNQPVLNQVQGIRQIASFRSAQQQAAAVEAARQASTNRVQSLNADTASFLKQHTSNVSLLGQSASLLAGDGMNSLLFGSTGSATDESIAQTVGAVQGLVENYNYTLQNLLENEERGPAVQEQADQLQETANGEELAEAGITRQADGTLALDNELLAQALERAVQDTSAPDALQRLQERIAGPEGFAQEVQNEADAALREPAANLIAKDLQELQQSSREELASGLGYTQNGTVPLGNQMAAGLLMNLAV